MKFRLLTPQKCEPDKIDAFYNLVIAGNQVSSHGLKKRILSAELLAFCETGNEIIGIASIKNPSTNYKVKIFQLACVKELANNYRYEIGYAVTKKEFRKKGISQQLIKSLIDTYSGEYIFATTKVESMCNILEKVGFKKIGESFSNSHKETIVLYGYNNDHLKPILDNIT